MNEEELWIRHNSTPKELEEIEQWMIERHTFKRQLEEARELIEDAVTQLSYYSACAGTQATEFLDRNKDLIEQLKEKNNE
ncbi:MAG: hypothetical protein HRU21_09190 [Pseudomonadales bacterium]|nr:hypothetical protein [Pseudomonadales bacterium]